MKAYVVALFYEFHDDTLDLQKADMTLIPEVDGVSKVTEVRPISLSKERQNHKGSNLPD